MPEDVVKIHFVKEGIDLTAFKSYRIESDFLMPVDAFEFVMYAPRTGAALSFDQLFDMTQFFRPIEIYVNNNLQMLGVIDKQIIGGDGSSITIQGRDYLSNLIEGYTDPSTRWISGMTLEAALLELLKPFGISEIVDGNDEWRSVQIGVPYDDVQTNQQKSFNKGSKVVASTSNVLVDVPTADGGTIAQNKQVTTYTNTNDSIVQDAKPQPNEKVWSNLEKLASRKGYTIQPTTSRSKIALAKPEYNQPVPFKLQRHLDGNGNNIIDGTVTRDGSKVPTYCMAYGKYGSAVSALSPGKFSRSTFGPDAISSIGNNPDVRAVAESIISKRNAPKVVIDENDGKLYRPIFIHDTEAKSQDEFEHAVNRMIAELMKDLLQVEYTVKGHSQDGLIWTVDNLAAVEDEVAKVSQTLWISGRTIQGDSKSGTTTKLRLWIPDSFVI